MGRSYPERRQIRLDGYDYTRPGQYFITIVTFGREEMFGTIADGSMEWSAAGRAVNDVWKSLPRHYPRISLDAFVVMPNHVHGIIRIDHRASDSPSRSPLSEIVRGFKTYAARRVNQHRGVSGVPVWQRGYYERIIRDDRELENVRRYIRENPARWPTDSENPANLAQHSPPRTQSQRTMP
jgi:REP element-mobilizing transposase RayT